MSMKLMKILMSVLFTFMLFGTAAAQDCSYYAFSKGTTLAYQNLDAKGKITGSTRTTCLDVNHTGDGVVFRVQSEYTDAKNSKATLHEFDMRCENGQFYVDMRNFVDPKSMEAFKDMEVKVNSKDMIYPSGLAAGQTLPDASVSLSAGSGDVTLLNLVMHITNRQVIGVESVTVPAGTFECFKITYDVEAKMLFKMNYTVTEYLNIGAGNVKTETYDKKGKLQGSVVLTELKK